MKNKVLFPFLSFIFLSISFNSLNAETAYVPVQTLLPRQDIPFNPAAGTGFGVTVLVKDDFAFVTSPFVRPDNKPIEGAVYVYKKKGGEWVNTQILETHGDSDHLGLFQVELHGRWLFISSIGTPVGLIPNDVLTNQNFSGSVVIYKLNRKGQFELFQIIDRSLPGLENLSVISPAALNPAIPAFLNEQGANFGLHFDVDLENQTMIVGAQYQAAVDGTGATLINVGAAYILKQNSDKTWSLSQKLVSPDGPRANDSFGGNVALHDGVALVSSALFVQAPKLGNNFQTNVYVYREIDGQFIFQEKLFGNQLTPSIINSPVVGTVALGSNFGSSLALDDKWAIIGAGFETRTPGGTLSGAAYFYKVKKSDQSAHLSFKQKVFSDDPQTQATALQEVTLSGNTALIGDPGRTGPNGPSQGGVLVYKNEGGTWVQKQVLYDPNGKPFSFFGASASKSGKYIFAGSDIFALQKLLSALGNPLLPPNPNSALPTEVVVFKGQKSKNS